MLTNISFILSQIDCLIDQLELDFTAMNYLTFSSYTVSLTLVRVDLRRNQKIRLKSCYYKCFFDILSLSFHVAVCHWLSS